MWTAHLCILGLLSGEIAFAPSRVATVTRGTRMLSSDDSHRGHQLADLSSHYTPAADVDEAEAVSLRRRLRFEAGRAWLWEPSEAADPGISWELIGIVQECRLYPTRGEAAAYAPRESHAEDMDRTRKVGRGSPTRTSAYAVTSELPARKRLSAMLRLK